MPQLNVAFFASQIFWLIISFSLLYILVSKFSIPKMAKIFAAREEQISQALSKAEHFKEQALDLKHEYDKEIALSLLSKQEMLKIAQSKIAQDTEQKIAMHADKLKQELDIAQSKLELFKEQSKELVSQLSLQATKEILTNFAELNIDQELLKRELEKLAEKNNA